MEHVTAVTQEHGEIVVERETTSELHERARALVSDWQANAGSRALDDPTAETWNKAARQLLEILEPETEATG